MTEEIIIKTRDARKEKYKQLCEEESSIPLYSQYWWLDAIAGSDNWDVCLVEKNNRILASMPYVITKMYGMTIIRTPALTKNMGPWIRKIESKYAKKLGKQKNLMEQLIEQLPSYSHFSQNWYYDQRNWLPFYWKGFKQTTRYSYIIKNNFSEDEAWMQLAENVRREIRKASNRYKLTLRENPTIDDFIALHQRTFERQNIKYPHSVATIKRLDKACKSKRCNKIYIVEDSDKVMHAGVYLVWDENSAYYLMGGGDPEYRTSGAASLCMWEAIKYTIASSKQFDFEGSMIESIERFFRGFGATQEIYFNVSKTPSLILSSAKFMKEYLAQKRH